jgi:hypothetical protein
LALAALIAAYEQTDANGGLRATLPLMGRTLVEHQARQAARVGARHIVILVERLPAELTAAIDRLRRDGLAIDVARSVADAADRIHPDEQLIMFADGCIAGQGAVDSLAASPSPTLLTLPDEPGRSAFERIDAATRWAGLALIDGSRLRATAAMLGEWDLQSTLLRRTVQEGAARLNIFAVEDGAGSARLPIIADGDAALADLERYLLAGSRGPAKSWPQRYLFRWVEEPALRRLLNHVSEPLWIAALAAGLAVAAAAVAMAGWLSAALLLLLASGPVAAIAQRLAAMRLGLIRHQRLIETVRALAAGAALFAGAGFLAEAGGWGWWLVAAIIVGVTVALEMERRIKARLTGHGGPLWLASVDGLIWAVAPFMLLGAMEAGLLALALYATGSFAYVQWRLWRWATKHQV